MPPRTSRYIRQNVLGLVAIFIALSGTAWAAATIGANDIKDNAVRSNHIKDGHVKDNELAADAIPAHDVFGGSPKIADNAVGGSEIAAFSVTGLKVFDGSLTGDDIADGTIKLADLEGDAQGPAGYQLRDNDTGEICNGFCTEGSLVELPPGFYAVFGKIVLKQSFPDIHDQVDDLEVDCELHGPGSVVLDRARIGVGADFHVPEATLSMQALVNVPHDRGNVSINCRDFAHGSVFGSDLKIVAIKLGLVFSSTPSPE